MQLADGADQGRTDWKREAGKHEIAVSVDTCRFFDHFFSVFE